jgi:hypothetical protein
MKHDSVTRFVALVALAACGGSGNSNGDGANGSGDGKSNVDAPPPMTPLDQRITVASISAPGGVKAGDGSFRIWGFGSLNIAPVYTAPYADCGTLVGYTTGTSAPYAAHVARLDATDHLMATHDLGAYVVRGIAAEPDGHWAVLLWDPSASTPVLYVQRYDSSGAAVGTLASLADALAAPTDFGIGESRLTFGNGTYGAYYHVHGISGFANGHEGDQLKWIDTSGTVTNGWSWGCSHSMSELLPYQPASTTTLPICVTDCYPGTSGSNFATDSIGGVYLNNSRDVRDVDGGCNGSVAGELGGATAAPSGWKLVFNAHQNAATNGQSSYNASSMNQDIGFASIAADQTPSAVVWLTTTTGNEANSTIARWQPAGDDHEYYVAGWNAGSAYDLAVVDGAGATIAAPIDVSSKAQWGERDDPFREHLNHDIVWAWFDSVGATTFHFARLSSGRTATCASL